MTQVEKIPATFVTMKNVFAEEFSRSLENGGIDNIKTKWSSFDAKDSERRIAMEEAVRSKLIELMVTDGNGQPSLEQEAVPYLLDTVMSLCRRELVSPVLSVCLLSDLFDTSTISRCEKIFDFVERHVATWKEPLFFTACKNNILRMCNDLLRRLSKTQHNIFSGRILLFLAMFFPFSERSGLNIVSEFNVDSFIIYDTEDVKDDADDSIEIVDSTVKLDSTFYSKFWSLQEYFRSPNICYNKVQWKEFVNNANTVLSVFKNFKLTSESHEWSNSLNEPDDGEFITKFLTNQKLLLHQLEDTYFRRTIYIQFLVLFQFLTAQIKTKQESNELKPDQVEWVKSCTEKVHKLIKESPPNGEQFLSNILQLLKRDEHWSRWKNEGCPALKKVMTQYDKPTFQNKPPTTNTCDWTNLGTILCRVKSTDKIIMPRIDGPEVVDMKHDYLAFCKGRSTVPELNVFLKEAIQQSESQEAIEPSLKKVADKQFSWVALKLLSQKSPHFFSLNQPPISKLPDFVDHICRKIYREQNPGLLLPPLMPAPKSNMGGPTNKADSTAKRTVNARANSVGATNSIKEKTTNAEKSRNSASNSQSAPPAKMQKTASANEKQVKQSSGETKQSTGTVKSSEKNIDKTSQLTQKTKEKAEKKEKTPEKGKSAVPITQQTKSKSEKSQEKVKTEKAVKNHDKESSKSKKDKSPVKRKRTDDRESDEKRIALSSGKKSKDRKEDTPVEDEPPALKTEQISKLAKLISGSWKKVADKLGYKADEIEYFESQQDTDYNRALNLLLIWTSNEEDATADSLRRCLKDLGMADAANILAV